MYCTYNVLNETHISNIYSKYKVVCVKPLHILV